MALALYPHTRTTVTQRTWPALPGTIRAPAAILLPAWRKDLAKQTKALRAKLGRALRELEGEWAFDSLEVDGAAMPTGVFANSRILMDGDRFRMESAEATYDGTFVIDVELVPATIDITFVEGPEAGNTALGIFELEGDRLTICLGLVGSDRPKAFKIQKGSGHALERLRRASTARPAGVTSGTRKAASAPKPSAAVVNPKTFEVPTTPLLAKIAGEWAPTRLVRNGEPMNDQWLSFGSRTASGNEVKVVFGGQTMVHAKVRLDEKAAPVAIDYLGLSGSSKGKVSFGILDWVGDELRVNMAPPGKPRPADFTCPKGGGRTLSQWKRAR